MRDGLNGLRWRDAPSAYGPYKTLYNRWKRGGAAGVFTRMMEALAAAGGEPNTVMIDATCLKVHPRRGNEQGGLSRYSILSGKLEER